MGKIIQKIGIDWVMLLATFPLLGAGLATMNSFVGESTYFARQIVWIGVGLLVFFLLSSVDFRFLRRTNVIVTLFLVICGALLLLFTVGHVAKGAESWFRIGFVGIQPSDPAKLVLILLLAKYFSKRHVEIKHFKHILVSGVYAFVIFLLVLLQPDFGSAVIIFSLWLGMVLVSGISKKHLALVGAAGLIVFAVLWVYGFKDYQKQRIINFIHPLSNVSGSGYNARQSMIAVGSGQLTGKGLGYGTQSRLKFLPEYQTDFIFAAFAEEWGFVGVLIIFISFGILLWRIALNTVQGVSNFEILYGAGLCIYFVAHFFINVGMNIGILPVTGLVAPLMSYGGSHIVTEFIGLGILMGMRKYGKAVHKDVMKNEFLGIE